MRTTCIALALVALASLPAQARGTSSFRFFPSQTRSTRAWFPPAPRVQVYVVKYRMEWVNGYKMRFPYITPKLHCYSPTLCMPVYRKASKA